MSCLNSAVHGASDSELYLILLQCWKTPPHLLHWICKFCFCLCQGTCLPSRSNRIFPVDGWPAMTAVPRCWSPMLSSVSSSWLFLHLAQETKASTDRITIFEDKCLFFPHRAYHQTLSYSTLHTIANWLSVCCYGYLSVGCLNIILQDCFRTTTHIMPCQEILSVFITSHFWGTVCFPIAIKEDMHMHFYHKNVTHWDVFWKKGPSSRVKRLFMTFLFVTYLYFVASISTIS